MSAAYVLPESVDDPVVLKRVRDRLPLRFRLADGTECRVEQLGIDNGDRVSVVRGWLNDEIDAGTYPQNEPYESNDSFAKYFLSHFAFVLVFDATPAVPRGAFYCKPNFPGRCSHICNGGFVVAPEQRRRGVGELLAVAFETLAPLCGYRAAFFNLVFEDNPTSLRMWQRRGFRQVGCVPRAKFDAQGRGVNAYMMYKSFDDDVETVDSAASTAL